MISQQIYEEERIIREASIIGNGAHIFVPKEWIGERIILIKTPRQTLKHQILSVLEPHLDKIIGIYLAGSYARNEQEKDSDIDLFVITSEKLSIKKEGFEIICLEKDKIKDTIKISPILIYSLIREAKTIINNNLLEELKRSLKPKIEDFRDYFKELNNIIEINQEILDYKQDSDYDAVAYSLILRLRGIFLIKCLLNKKIYSKNLFKKWIISNSVSIDFESVYQVYRSVKNNIKIKKKSHSKDLYLLLDLLKKETNMENEKKKEASKRN